MDPHGRKRMTTTIRRAALGALAAAALCAAGGASAQEGPARYGGVEVTVQVEGGKPLAGGTVYAKGATAPVTAAGTAVALQKVATGKTAVTVDARVTEAGKERRYLGVAEATVAENQVAPVTVTVVPVPVIDDFCLGCHPNPRDSDVKPKPGQIVRDIHTSGRQYPDKGYDAYVAQNRRHNEEVERLAKEGKPHNLPMPIESRLVRVGGKEVERWFYTCETCHTLHASTSWTKFVRAPFKNSSDLCMGCHS